MQHNSSPTPSRGKALTRREATARIVGAAASTSMLSSLFAQDAPTPTPPPAEEWRALAEKLQGSVTPRGAATFTEVKDSLVWNSVKPDRSPEAIVRAASIDDVQQTVKFARQHGIKVAIRGGGHSWCASAVRETGILLDLGALNTLDVDAASKRAVAGPAVTGGTLVEALLPHGLAFPVGHCPTVPLSGFILNGGFGWNTGTWGPACTNLVGLDLVTADGELIYADESNHPDYFWAARGAGPGFFGVAVRYHLQLHPLPQAIRTRQISFPIDAAEDVGRWLGQLAAHLRPELELLCTIGPAAPGVPKEFINALGRTITLTAVAFADTREQADEWLSLLALPDAVAHYGPPAIDTPLPALLEMMSAAYPHGKRYAADMMWCNAWPAEILPTVADSINAAPSRESFALVVISSPAPANAPPPDMALSMFGRVLVGLYSVWDDANADLAHQNWLHRGAYGLRRDVVGHYVGETDFTLNANRARTCFAAAQWKKLEELRQAHDPAGVFHTFLGYRGT